MGRETSDAFDAAIAGPVTAVGYLFQILLDQGSPDVSIRLCDIGTFVYNGQTFSAFDFTVSGFSLDLNRMGAEGVVVTLQNLDGAALALLLNNAPYDAPVTIWQVARDDVGSPTGVLAGDPIKLLDAVVDGVDIGLDVVQIRLLPTAIRFKYAPWRRVDAANGLANATPEGTRIVWGMETLVMERYNG